MPDVDYLRYAQLATQRNPFAEGLAGISQTLQTGRQQAMQEEQMRRAARLSDIQARSGEATLAGTLAEQEGMRQAYGTENLPGAYAAKEKAAIQSAAQKQAMEKGGLIKDMFEKTNSAVEKRMMEPEEAEMFFKGTMKMAGIDFEKAGMKFSFTKKGGYYSGPINEQSLFMVNGKPVPFGNNGIVEKAHVVGVAPDGVSPIYQMDENTKFSEPKAEKPAIGSEFDVFVTANRKAGKTDTQILDAWNERELGRKKAGRSVGGAGMPKAPSGYRYTASGDLEPIPGGPAAVKAGVAARGEEGKMASLDITIRSIQDLLKHPGRKAATGTSGALNKLAVPGSDRKGFLAKLDTLKAQTFIPQVAALKGMGALSDAEGKKLTDAVGALDPQMPEDEFVASLNQIQSDLIAAKARISPENAETPTAPAVGRGGTGGKPSAAPTKRPPLSSFRKR